MGELDSLRSPLFRSAQTTRCVSGSTMTRRLSRKSAVRFINEAATGVSDALRSRSPSRAARVSSKAW